MGGHHSTTTPPQDIPNSFTAVPLQRFSSFYLWCPSPPFYLSTISMFSTLCTLVLSLKYKLTHPLVRKAFPDFWKHCHMFPSLGPHTTLLRKPLAGLSLGMKPLRQVSEQCQAGESQGVREGAKGGQGTYSTAFLTPTLIYNPSQWWFLKGIKCTRVGGGS